MHGIRRAGAGRRPQPNRSLVPCVVLIALLCVIGSATLVLVAQGGFDNPVTIVAGAVVWLSGVMTAALAAVGGLGTRTGPTRTSRRATLPAGPALYPARSERHRRNLTYSPRPTIRAASLRRVHATTGKFLALTGPDDSPVAGLVAGQGRRLEKKLKGLRGSVRGDAFTGTERPAPSIDTLLAPVDGGLAISNGGRS